MHHLHWWFPQPAASKVYGKQNCFSQQPSIIDHFGALDLEVFGAFPLAVSLSKPPV
jgi:hypothetical protein